MDEIFTKQDIVTIIDGEIMNRFKGSIISRIGKNDGVVLRDGRMVLFNEDLNRWEYDPPQGSVQRVNNE